MSLAKRSQYNECCSFGDPDESGNSHPLFSSEKEYGVTKKVGPESCRLLRARFDASGLLPGTELSNVYKVSWVKLYGVKYKKSGVITIDACGDPVQPLFGEIHFILSVNNYVYFDVDVLTPSVSTTIIKHTKCQETAMRGTIQVSACLKA